MIRGRRHDIFLSNEYFITKKELIQIFNQKSTPFDTWENQIYILKFTAEKDEKSVIRFVGGLKPLRGSGYKI